MIRPLETRETRERRERKSKTIIGLIITIIMVLSIVGYALLWGNSNESIEEKGYKFFKTEKGWQTTVKIEGKKFTLLSYFLPSELENVSLNGAFALKDFRNKVIYITIYSDDEDVITAASFFRNLEPFVERIQFACPKEKENESFCSDLPIKECKSDFNSAIIVIKKGDKPKVSFEDCLIIEGEGLELIKAVQKAIFKIFGIL